MIRTPRSLLLDLLSIQVKVVILKIEKSPFFIQASNAARSAESENLVLALIRTPEPLKVGALCRQVLQCKNAHGFPTLFGMA